MAQIELHARHNPMAWLLYLTKLRVSVDGEARRLSWGTNVIEVPPGQHQVDISFGYMGKQRGPASATVAASEERPVSIHYSMPSWMFAKGRIRVG